MVLLLSFKWFNVIRLAKIRIKVETFSSIKAEIFTWILEHAYVTVSLFCC